MKTTPSRLIAQMVALLIALPCTLDAQRIDTIKANPDAKPLRKIWQVTGGEFGGGRVGEGFGSVSDINQDGYEDWAVFYGTDRVWRIYYGSDEPLSTTPVAILDSLGAVPYYPVVGDFWGTGHKAIAFPLGKRINGRYFYDLHLFRTDSNRLDTVPAVILDLSLLNPPVQSTPTSIAAADLDGDGDDELVMMFAGRTVNDTSTRKPEVWIYRGGPEFQVDSPTVVIRDSEVNGGSGQQSLVIAHTDDDDKLDLMTTSDYADGIGKIKFFFSTEGSPWNWSAPDRVVPSDGWYLLDWATLDCDGDGILDIAVPGPPYQVSLFLSSSGASIRTRPLTFDAADRSYRSQTYIRPFSAGYLSDSTRRFEVLGMIGEGVEYLHSGGPAGPDQYYDASTGELLGAIRPIGDVDGDG